MAHTETIVDDCPFPECGLKAEHDGDHVPRLRLVQRFTWPGGNWPGRCELDGCERTAAALYSRMGCGVLVCAPCEAKLLGLPEPQISSVLGDEAKMPQQNRLPRTRRRRSTRELAIS
jgi:hypothetical protein